MASGKILLSGKADFSIHLTAVRCRAGIAGEAKYKEFEELSKQIRIAVGILRKYFSVRSGGDL